MTTAMPSALADAREQFLALVDGVRPELHRYCARLTGSVIEGEDIVQDTLAKAFYALSLSTEVPPLRPWLFRIAHNAAIDFLEEPRPQVHRRCTPTSSEIAGFEDKPDPAVVRAALARFLALPVTQRSAVILKDVLGHSLEETAETMGTTVMAVKAALVRGRAKLLGGGAGGGPDRRRRRAPSSIATRASSTPATGTACARSSATTAGSTSSRSRSAAASRSACTSPATRRRTWRSAWCAWRARLALAAHVAGAARPAYFILLELDAGRVQSIRDFRYVPYIALEADLEIAPSSSRAI